MKTNYTQKTKAGAEQELQKRKTEFPIMCKDDTIFELVGYFFVGTYYEYKLHIGI
jgi:hypothetical protein